MEHSLIHKTISATAFLYKFFKEHEMHWYECTAVLTANHCSHYRFNGKVYEGKGAKFFRKLIKDKGLVYDIPKFYIYPDNSPEDEFSGLGCSFGFLPDTPINID